MTNTRIHTLESAVARYQKSLDNFVTIHEELRRLPPSERLAQILELSEGTLRTTAQLVANARDRLERERKVSSAACTVETTEG